MAGMSTFSGGGGTRTPMGPLHAAVVQRVAGSLARQQMRADVGRKTFEVAAQQRAANVGGRSTLGLQQQQQLSNRVSQVGAQQFSAGKVRQQGPGIGSSPQLKSGGGKIRQQQGYADGPSGVPVRKSNSGYFLP